MKMQKCSSKTKKIEEIFEQYNVDVYGYADIHDVKVAQRPEWADYPFAVSFALGIDPEVMAGIAFGPTKQYADEYLKINEMINSISEEIEKALVAGGNRAVAVPASKIIDEENFTADYSHKAAGTRAGLGWIGRHSMLISKQYGPWMRLGTVLTDADLPPGTPFEKSGCKSCIKCFEFCPSGAIKGTHWVPGISRDELIDAELCSEYMKKNFSRFNKGLCGICASICSHGVRRVKR